MPDFKLLDPNIYGGKTALILLSIYFLYMIFINIEEIVKLDGGLMRFINNYIVKKLLELAFFLFIFYFFINDETMRQFFITFVILYAMSRLIIEANKSHKTVDEYIPGYIHYPIVVGGGGLFFLEMVVVANNLITELSNS